MGEGVESVCESMCESEVKGRIVCMGEGVVSEWESCERGRAEGVRFE